MSIIQWLGIMSAAIAGNAIGFLVFGRRLRSARMPELRIVRIEPDADDCNCDVCRARRRKQAEVAAN